MSSTNPGQSKRPAPWQPSGRADKRSKPSSERQPRTSQACWHPRLVETFLRELHALVQAEQHSSPTSFDVYELESVAEALNEYFGTALEVPQLRSKIYSLRSSWKDWEKHLARCQEWESLKGEAPVANTRNGRDFIGKHPRSESFLQQGIAHEALMRRVFTKRPTDRVDDDTPSRAALDVELWRTGGDGISDRVRPWRQPSTPAGPTMSGALPADRDTASLHWGSSPGGDTRRARHQPAAPPSTTTRDPLQGWLGRFQGLVGELQNIMATQIQPNLSSFNRAVARLIEVKEERGLSNDDFVSLVNGMRANSSYADTFVACDNPRLENRHIRTMLGELTRSRTPAPLPTPASAPRRRRW